MGGAMSRGSGPAHPARGGVALAVCDVLVVRALETLGKYLVRSDRSRFRVLGGRPFHVAHVLWLADDALVSKVLKHTWDIVPFLWVTFDDNHKLASVLDTYVRALATTGTPHNTTRLHRTLKKEHLL